VEIVQGGIAASGIFQVFEADSKSIQHGLLGVRFTPKG
jgi:hypothetical protein